jgi:hypothetical protein
MSYREENGEKGRLLMKQDVNTTKRRNAALRRALYKRAAESLRKAADCAEKKDRTWARVYADAGLSLLVAAELL